MGFENIIIRVENQVGWLEYNRPPVNAVHWEKLRELPQAVQCLLEDDDVRVVVFASALEKFFSTGADLEVFADIDVEGMTALTMRLAMKVAALTMPVRMVTRLVMPVTMARLVVMAPPVPTKPATIRQK